MSNTPINDMSVLLDHVYWPFIRNAINSGKWPEVIRKSVETHTQEFRNAIAEVKI